MKRMSLILVMMALSALPAVGAAAESIHWLTLKEGSAKAKLEKKPMLVDYYYGKGCPRCEKLDKEVYANPDIAHKIVTDFIPVRVDLTTKLTDEEEKVGERYDYKKECLLLFLDPAGNAIADPEGKRLSCAAMMDPETFVQYLDKVKKTLTDTH